MEAADDLDRARHRWAWLSVFIVLLSGLAACRSVDWSDLGIGPDDLISCVRTDVVAGPTAYPPPGLYDQEEIARLYLPYAVAALNAYAYTKDGTRYESDGHYSRFTLSAYDEAWVRQDRIEEPGGLALDYYFNDAEPKTFAILVAFRGTEMTSFADWWSNLAWITQLVPIDDQYDHAREAVAEIRRRAKTAANGKSLTLLTTGHSLGGGLAAHVAYAFPCTSAVVFDASFVVNRHRLANPFEDAQVVHVFDKNDELTGVRRWFFSDTESATYKRYGINPVARGGLQHRSLPLAVGMARMVAMCQADLERPDAPGCPKSDMRARRLFCGSTYAAREQAEPQCRF